MREREKEKGNRIISAAFSSTLVMMFLILSSSCNAKHLKQKLPNNHRFIPITTASAVIIGTVYCDTCFSDDFSHFISGATVAVVCKDKPSKLTFRQEASTDEKGKFRVRLPYAVMKHVHNIEKRCHVKLVKSSEPNCAVASSPASSTITRSIIGTRLIFKAGFFTFKPHRLCNREPITAAAAAAGSRERKFKHHQIRNPSSLGLVNPRRRTIPKFLPFLPRLPELPPLPQLPSLPQLPPLPQLPSLPQFPSRPALPASATPKLSTHMNRNKIKSLIKDKKLQSQTTTKPQDLQLPPLGVSAPAAGISISLPPNPLDQPAQILPPISSQPPTSPIPSFRLPPLISTLAPPPPPPPQEFTLPFPPMFPSPPRFPGLPPLSSPGNKVDQP